MLLNSQSAGARKRVHTEISDFDIPSYPVHTNNHNIPMDHAGTMNRDIASSNTLGASPAARHTPTESHYRPPHSRSKFNSNSPVATPWVGQYAQFSTTSFGFRKAPPELMCPSCPQYQINPTPFGGNYPQHIVNRGWNMLPNRRRAYHHNGPAGPLENDELDPSAPAPIRTRASLPEGYSPNYGARQDGLEDSNHLGILQSALILHLTSPFKRGVVRVERASGCSSAFYPVPLTCLQNLVQKKQMEQQISRQQQVSYQLCCAIFVTLHEEWKSRYWTAQEHQRFLEGLKDTLGRGPRHRSSF
eukprot:758882-Hanusia_phi.AAC.7